MSPALFSCKSDTWKSGSLLEAWELMRKAMIVAALVLCAPTFSEAKTLEELLVEKGVITQGEAIGTSNAGGSKVYWNKGTRVEFPDTGFTTQISTLLQERYTYEDTGVEGEKNKSSFTQNRARLIIQGTALNKQFAYMLSTDFISASDSDANFGEQPGVRDAYIDWQPCNDESGIRFGAFKTAISRQFNTNQATLQFADRSQVSEYFTIGRANGAMAFGALADGMIQGSAGIFNGESTGEGPNLGGVDTRQMGIASVRVNPLGKMDVTEEGDVDYTEEAALSFGAAYAYSSANVYDTVDEMSYEEVGVSRSIVNIDANFKYEGWSVHTEYFYQDTQNGTNDDYSDFANAADPSGFYVQGGMFILPKKLELAARYGYTDCANGQAGGICAGVDDYNEAAATINYYFWRHSLKAQLGYMMVQADNMSEEPSYDSTNNKYIFQVSSLF